MNKVLRRFVPVLVAMSLLGAVSAAPASANIGKPANVEEVSCNVKKNDCKEYKKSLQVIKDGSAQNWNYLVYSRKNLSTQATITSIKGKLKKKGISSSYKKTLNKNLKALNSQLAADKKRAAAALVKVNAADAAVVKMITLSGTSVLSDFNRKDAAKISANSTDHQLRVLHQGKSAYYMATINSLNILMKHNKSIYDVGTFTSTSIRVALQPIKGTGAVKFAIKSIKKGNKKSKDIIKTVQTTSFNATGKKLIGLQFTYASSV